MLGPMGHHEFEKRWRTEHVKRDNASFMTVKDMDRIEKRLNPSAVSDERAERLRLKQLSDARVTKWPNTLEAERAKKEREKEERELREEERKKEIDRVQVRQG